MKKLYILLTFCMIAAFAFDGLAKSRSAHAKAHQEMLAAAAKSKGLDKATINKMVEADIAAREQANSISKETEEILSDLMSEARSHLGKRYSRGSKGPKAFDCSGFSSYVFRQFGVKLGASSHDQWAQGESVERTDLRKGDLVFFKGRSVKGGVGHVGIVTEADGNGNFKFIHASNSLGITISSNKEPYYAARFVGSKRVIE